MRAGMTGSTNAGDAGPGHDHTTTRCRAGGDNCGRIRFRCSARTTTSSFERSDECPVRVGAVRSPSLGHRLLEFISREHPGDFFVEQPLGNDGANHPVGRGRRGVIPTIESDIFGNNIEHGQRIPEIGDLGPVEEA